MKMQNEQYLLPSEVSKIIQVSERQLARQRQTRCGIPFVRLGHKLIRYKKSDVDTFMTSNTVKTNLSLTG